MNGNDWAEAIGAAGLFTLVITVVTVVIVQVAKTLRAKAEYARQDESRYRALAERSVELQEATERRLAALDDQVGHAQARIASIEQILKQVE